MLNTIVGAGVVGAGAASRYGSGTGFDQKMRLRLRNTGFYVQNCSQNYAESSASLLLSILVFRTMFSGSTVQWIKSVILDFAPHPYVVTVSQKHIQPMNSFMVVRETFPVLP
jgi:hypothetical protein